MKKKIIEASSVGKLMILIGIFVTIPLVTIPFYDNTFKYFFSFLFPGVISISLGILVCIFAKRDIDKKTDRHSLMQRSSLTVLFAWSWGVLIGALPFIFGNQLRIIPSLFESVSGWTTTGLSVMDVAITPPIYLFHRSFMQYCGGLGFIMMMILLISNKQSMSLYSAEGHPDKIKPNLKKTAQAIFIVYNISLVLGTIAYRIAGMNWFDGICHSMCSLSTGGFSTKLNSIGEYNNLSIEIITILLMLIGTTNFAALLLLAKGKVKAFFKVSEVKFMFYLLIIIVPITAVSLSNSLEITYLEGLRKSLFDVISALSTTGYSTMSYSSWPQFALAILILMMIIGGGVGSTAGGIKLSRVYLILKMVIINIKKRFMPATQVTTNYYVKAQGKEIITKELEADTYTFFISYLIIYIIGTLAMLLVANCTLLEAMFDFASSLSTVGLSIGITNPLTNNATLIVEMVGMILGRLEIFIVVIGITFGVSIIKDTIKKFTK